MMQDASSPSSLSDPLCQGATQSAEETQAYYSDKTYETTSSASFFPVTEKVTFKPMQPVLERRALPLPPSVARLVSLVGLSTIMLWPLSACDSGEANLPCSVPTPNPAATSVPDGTPTASCTTSNGTHYLWIHSRGGWVQSDDGVHPNSDASGVGVDDGHDGSGSSDEGHGGVGDGHGGTGHGGGDGG
jgi:hypothetical protein